MSLSVVNASMDSMPNLMLKKIFWISKNNQDIVELLKLIQQTVCKFDSIS